MFKQPQVGLFRKGLELWAHIGLSEIPIVNQAYFDGGGVTLDVLNFNSDSFVALKTLYFSNLEAINAFSELAHICRPYGKAELKVIAKQLAVKDQEILLRSNLLTEEERELLMWLWVERNTPPKEKRKTDGWVYLMKDPATGYIKIGFSTNPTVRESTLQAEKPSIELMIAWQGTLPEEKRLHAEFVEKQIRGEWFDLSEDDISRIGEFFAGRQLWQTR